MIRVKQYLDRPQDPPFRELTYDGSYHTPQSEAARTSFCWLTDCVIIWTQVHGDFKNAIKRVEFVPYPHWPELYECCRAIVIEHGELGTWWSEMTAAKMMGEAMALLRLRHGLTVPKWWLPIMNRLRGRSSVR